MRIVHELISPDLKRQQWRLSVRFTYIDMTENQICKATRLSAYEKIAVVAVKFSTQQQDLRV